MDIFANNYYYMGKVKFDISKQKHPNVTKYSYITACYLSLVAWVIDLFLSEHSWAYYLVPVCIERADCRSDGVWYLLIYVFIILNSRPLGMVAGWGWRWGKATKQTAGVLLLSVDELLHEALPVTHTHGTCITKQSHANTQGTSWFQRILEDEGRRHSV